MKFNNKTITLITDANIYRCTYQRCWRTHSPAEWSHTSSWSTLPESLAWERWPTCSPLSASWGCLGWWGYCLCRRTVTETQKEERKESGGKKGERESVVSIIWNWRQNFFLDETTAAKREQISSDKSTEGAPIWILHGCHIKDSLLMYQNVIGPAFPGEVERCLLQLHDVLVPAVGPVLGSQLAYIGPKTESNNADIVLSHS